MKPHELREARKRLRLSQSELAEKLGLRQQTHVSMMETGKKAISKRTATQVQMLLHMKESGLPPAPSDPSPLDPAG